MDYNRIKKQLREEIQNRLDFGKDWTDQDIQEAIDDAILDSGKGIFCSLDMRKRLRKELFDSLRRLDILQIFVEDSEISEIMINGMDAIFVEKKGRIIPLDIRFDSPEKLNDVIQRIVAGCNRVVNEASPIVDARLSDGSRVNVVMPPIALNGPIVTIRRFPEHPITMEQLIEFQSISPEVAELLRRMVAARYNIFISGGTGSGKTTFLNVLSAYIEASERVITVEDSAELQLMNISNLVRLETRNSNMEGCREISMRDLIRSSLRMRPDRIIVGEVRGAEAFDMLQCMNTGHDGSMCTGHANSARDMLSRLENMILMGMDLPLLAIRQQIASGIDILVHLGRLRDKTRRVMEVWEILGISDGEYQLSPLYLFEEAGETEDGRVLGGLVRKGELQNVRKLKEAGLS